MCGYPKLENFCWHVEQSLLREGGFPLISGDPGTGKSVALRVLADRLTCIRDTQLGVISHASSRIAAFIANWAMYFMCNFQPTITGVGSKIYVRDGLLTLVRPVLIIDEAQEMSPEVLSELRLLTSMQFD